MMIRDVIEKDSQFVEDVFDLINQGNRAEEIIQILQSKQEVKQEQNISDDIIPSDIKVVSQALAFSEPCLEDMREIYNLLLSAYNCEVFGNEKFLLKSTIQYDELIEIFKSNDYKWLMAQCPSGRGIIADSSILGVCCYSTSGYSRKDGKIEGKLGSIRYFAVLPQFQGLCIGQRLLKRLENIISRFGCCRAMICAASSRCSLQRWIERRGYVFANKIPYPSLDRSIFIEKPCNVFLNMYIKPLNQLENLEMLCNVVEKQYDEFDVD